ncbi:ABC transporter permease subunit [Flavobacterium gelidilacus]|jgi:ABC-type transport system involved in multi-copper enzyme maturation permease subunit|uniref:ABC transporter permease n=1 Tax=Flavobacterium gelidilacus TaxID=206041 RepID=UPI0004232308|nr:ABC transporter permease subunit [Flavobacterium gelidilacus]
MIRLLNIEFQKLWKNRASKVLTITYFVLLTLISLIAAVEFDIGPIHISVADQGVFNFPFIWHFNTYVADYFKIFLAVVIVSMMANEYSYGTLKQNLIDGMSKKEFVLSKFITVVLFALISTLFVFIVSLILGTMYSSYTEIGIIFSQIDYLLAFFVKLVAFFSFCLFLGVLIKRSAFALGFLLFWYMFEGISFAILKFLILGQKNNEETFIDKIYDFMPLESMSNLIIEPLTRLNFAKTIGSQVGIENIKDYSVHYTTLIIVLIWTAIFIFGSYYIVKKRDL